MYNIPTFDVRYKVEFLMTKSLYQQAAKAAEYLNTKEQAPKVALVLGSGLSIFADRLKNTVRIPYKDIPYFHHSTVPGHAGELVIGTLSNNVRIAALCGRSHLYEGLAPSEIVHPTRSLSLWGCKGIIFTNAAGGIAPDHTPGDLMLITDHINLTGKNPLVGSNDPKLGARFVDMTQAYDHEFSSSIRSCAQKKEIGLKEGTYISLLGPSYETPAEIRMYQGFGAHAVGMSTVLEVIAARQSNMRVAGISCITNLGSGLQGAPLDHAEVKETALLVRETVGDLIEHSLHSIEMILT
jgi:purine-nucleoside phosphorylase